MLTKNQMRKMQNLKRKKREIKNRKWKSWCKYNNATQIKNLPNDYKQRRLARMRAREGSV